MLKEQTYHAFISLRSDKCLPFIFIGWSDFSGGVLSIFTGCESAVELLVEKSKAGEKIINNSNENVDI